MSSTKARSRTTSTDTNDTFVTTNNNNNSTNNTSLPRTTNLANAVVEKSIVDCGATLLDYYDQLLNEVSIHDIPTTASSSSEERKTKVERKERRVRFTNCNCLDEDTAIDDTTLTYPSQEGDSTTIIPPPPPIESSVESISTKDDIAAEMPTLTQVLDEELDRACFDTLTYFCGDPCGPSSNSPSQKKSKHQNKPSSTSTSSYNPNDITEFLGRGKDPSTYGENPDSLISGNSGSWWSSIRSSFDTRTKEDDDTLSTDGGGTIPVGKGKNEEGGACNPVLPEYLVGAVCCGEEDTKPVSSSKQESLSLPMRLKKSASFQPVRIHLLYRDRSSASNTSCVEFKTLEGNKKGGKLGKGGNGFANVVLKKATSLTRNISFGSSRQRSGISLGSRQKSGMPVSLNDGTAVDQKKKGPSSPSRSVQSTSTKESNSTTASSDDHTPITVKAVDSLGRKETAWKEYIDATTGKVYYSNGIKVSWNRPQGYVMVAKSNQKKENDNDMVGRSQSNTTEGGVHKSTLRRLFNVSGGGGKKMDAKKSTSVADKKKAPAYRQQDRHKKKKKVWKEYVDASSGKHYYSNGVETTWVKPQQ